MGDATINSLYKDLERAPSVMLAPIATISDTTLDKKYGWMIEAADEQIKASLLDIRMSNALLRENIRTWGELGALSDVALLKLQHVGVLSVRRLNEALSAYQPDEPKLAGMAAAFNEKLPEDDREASAVAFNLRASTDWLTVFSDDGTLEELLATYNSGVEVPDVVSSEISTLLNTPLSRLAGYPATPLSELVEELLSKAKEPELLIARECSRPRPTLEELGKEQDLTRERIRQKVAEDAERVRDLLKSERFRAVRWVTERLGADFGLVIPSESEIVDRWRERLGQRRFEMLRWLSDYTYKDDWLLKGASALNDLKTALDNAVRDEWLIKIEKLVASLNLPVHSEVVLAFLLESNIWRDIGEGWLVRWDGPIQAKAERVLQLTGRPMTPAEIVDKIGHGSIPSLKNQHGSTLIRIDKEFRLALQEWGYEEYEGITTEIKQRIDRGGGVASVSAILEEFVPTFGVKEASIHAYLEAGPYVIYGDEVRHLSNYGYTPSSVLGRQHAIKVRENWGQRFTVSDNNLKGYSFNLDRDIAAHNGLQPKDSLLVPAIHQGRVLGKASLIWRLANLSKKVDIGRLRSVLKRLGISSGDEIIIVATPTSCTLLRVDEIPQNQE